MNDELQFHLDREIEAHLERGMTPEAARTAALRAMGGVERRKDEIRDKRGVQAVENLTRDLRLAVRQLVKQPIFALAAILSLALGIGANTAIFQLLNAMSLRSLPVVAPHELVELRLTGNGRAGRHSGRNRQVSLPQFQEIERRQQAFSTMLAFGDTRFNLAPSGEVRYVEGLWVSGSFFDALGVKPLIGRLFTAADDVPKCGFPGAVISYALWQRDFGGRADVLQQTIPFGASRVPIVGVTPPSFFGLEVGRQFGVALPLCSSGFERRDHWWLAAVGRLKPGWSRAQAQAHISSVMPGVQRDTLPEYRADYAEPYLAMNAELVDASAGVSPLRRSYQQPLWVLMAIAGLVLLIASVNLANLLLARATARSQEFALRLALGGTRGRVLQQVFTESLLLAALGSAAALAVAVAVSRSILPLISTAVDPIYLDLSIDWRLFAFTATVGGATSLVFGMAPAIRASRARVLQPGQRGTGGHQGLRVRQGLVALQVAVTLVLLFGGGLFLRSFQMLATQDMGVQAEGVVVANVFFPGSTFPPEKRVLAYADLSERLRGLPGVKGVAEAFTTPMGGNFSDRSIKVNGEDKGETNHNPVSAGYFDAIGTPLVAGRDFDVRDVPEAPRVAIVNEAFAERFLDGRALGRQFNTASVGNEPETTYEVIGVVKNQKYMQIREPFPPIMYPASSQNPSPGLTQRYVVRSIEPPARTIAVVGSLLARVDPTISVRYAVLDSQIAESMMQERLMARLSMLFGVLALLLAVVGLYGVVSYTVASRRGEIGVRVALGAGRARILGMILGDVGRMMAIGVVAGAVTALVAARAVSSLLFGLDAADPGTLVLSIAILGAAGLAAAAIPARRAALMDPATTLRE